jgi:hypothetical protein
MYTSKHHWIWIGVAAVGIFALGLAAGLTWAISPTLTSQLTTSEVATDAEPLPGGLDVGKEAIELPLERVIGAVRPGDLEKLDIEEPVREVVSKKSALPPAAPVADGPKSLVIELPTEALVKLKSATSGPAANVVNPKVTPGKVTWHATFADARAASAKSGKPILLFQMLGKLDDQFC